MTPQCLLNGDVLFRIVDGSSSSDSPASVGPSINPVVRTFVVDLNTPSSRCLRNRCLMGHRPVSVMRLLSRKKPLVRVEVFGTWHTGAMRLDEVSGGGVVFLGCGCCGIRGPVLVFGRIWVQVLTPCGVHVDRVAEPLLLAVDEDVTGPFFTQVLTNGLPYRNTGRQLRNEPACRAGEENGTSTEVTYRWFVGFRYQTDGEAGTRNFVGSRSIEAGVTRRHDHVVARRNGLRRNHAASDHQRLQSAFRNPIAHPQFCLVARGIRQLAACKTTRVARISLFVHA